MIVQRQPIFSLSHSFFSLFVCSLIRKYGATKNTKLRGQTLAPTSATMNCSSKLSLSLSVCVLLSLLYFYSVAFWLFFSNICLFLSFSSFHRTVSGEVPEEPVVSTKSGLLYEKRLIERHISVCLFSLSLSLSLSLSFMLGFLFAFFFNPCLVPQKVSEKKESYNLKKKDKHFFFFFCSMANFRFS